MKKLMVIVAYAYPLVCLSVLAQDEFDDYWMQSYEMREKLVQDKFRPRYHFLPPEGRWNDISGAVFSSSSTLSEPVNVRSSTASGA